MVSLQFFQPLQAHLMAKCGQPSPAPLHRLVSLLRPSPLSGHCCCSGAANGGIGNGLASSSSSSSGRGIASSVSAIVSSSCCCRLLSLASFWNSCTWLIGARMGVVAHLLQQTVIIGPHSILHLHQFLGGFPFVVVRSQHGR